VFTVLVVDTGPLVPAADAVPVDKLPELDVVALDASVGVDVETPSTVQLAD